MKLNNKTLPLPPLTKGESINLTDPKDGIEKEFKVLGVNRATYTVIYEWIDEKYGKCHRCYYLNKITGQMK